MTQYFLFAGELDDELEEQLGAAGCKGIFDSKEAAQESLEKTMPAFFEDPSFYGWAHIAIIENNQFKIVDKVSKNNPDVGLGW